MKKGRGVSNKTIKTDKNKKDFLWWGLRISFFGMLGLIILFWVMWSYTTSDYSLLLLFFIIPLFNLSSIVFSVINLVKRKSKIFSIITLIVSVITFLMFMSLRYMTI